MKPVQDNQISFHQSESKPNSLSICSICSEQFVDVLHLESHVLTHDLEHSYSCSYCQNVYSDTVELQTHVLTHNIGTPFTCGLCHDKFKHSYELVSHQEYCCLSQRRTQFENISMCRERAPSINTNSGKVDEHYVENQKGTANFLYQGIQETTYDAFKLNQVPINEQNVSKHQNSEKQTTASCAQLGEKLTANKNSNSDDALTNEELNTHCGNSQVTLNDASLESNQVTIDDADFNDSDVPFSGIFTCDANLETNLETTAHANLKCNFSNVPEDHTINDQVTANNLSLLSQATRSDVECFNGYTSSNFDFDVNQVTDSEPENERMPHPVGDISSPSSNLKFPKNIEIIKKPVFENPIAKSLKSNYVSISKLYERRKSLENQTGSYTLTQNSVLQASPEKDRSIVIPKTDRLFSAYVNLLDIGPEVLQMTQTQNNSLSSKSSTSESILYELGSKKNETNTPVSLNGIQNLKREKPDIILTWLDNLKLCWSCCYPYSLSRGHSCLQSEVLPRKCGFCEVVFNSSLSLETHVSKIHKEKKNFCCIICCAVVGSELGYIEHFFKLHKEELKFSTSIDLKHIDSIASTVLAPIAKTQSRRSKCHPRKVIQCYDSGCTSQAEDSSDENHDPSPHDISASWKVSDAVELANNVPEEACTGGHKETSESPVKELLIKDGNEQMYGTEDHENEKNSFKKFPCDNKVEFAPSHGILPSDQKGPLMRIQSSKLKKSLKEITSMYSVCHNCCSAVKDVLEHLKTHTHLERLKCGFCGAQLKTEAAARYHYRNSHKLRNKINCHKCQWFGVSEKSYIKHCLQIHNKEMDLILPKELLKKTSVAPSVSSFEQTAEQSASDFIKTLLKNSGRKVKSLLCRFCSIVSLDLFEHYKSHNASDFLTCGFCLKTFSDRDKVSTHYNKTHSRKGISCRACKGFVGSEEMYIEHYLKNHTDASFYSSDSTIEHKLVEFFNKGSVNKSFEKTNQECLVRGITDLDTSRKPSTRGNTSEGFSQPVFPQWSPDQSQSLAGNCSPVDNSLSKDVSNLSVCRYCCQLHPNSTIKVHMKSHTPIERTQCGFCDKEFLLVEDVWRHQQKIHKDHLKCPFCSVECTSIEDYKDHFLQNHFSDLQNGCLKTKLRYFVCEFCAEVHKSKKRHYKTHSDFSKCGFCKTDFSRKYGVTLHFQERHKRPKFLVCPFCKMFSGSLNKYIKHYLMNHTLGFVLGENDVFVSSDFEEDSDQKLELDLSSKRNEVHNSVHKDSLYDLNENNVLSEVMGLPDDSFKLSTSTETLDMASDKAQDAQCLPADASDLSVCRHCCQLYPTSFIRHHTRLHTQEERSQCGFCDKEFTVTDDVWRHQQKCHTDNLKCPFCSEYCCSLEKYKDHFLSRHFLDMEKGRLKTILRYFVCEFCGEVHKSKKIHYKTHSDFTTCAFCKSPFNRKCGVKEHFIALHKNTRSIMCPVCQTLIGSEKKYIKHYLLNHTPDFCLQKNDEFAASDQEDTPEKLSQGIRNENRMPTTMPSSVVPSQGASNCHQENMMPQGLQSNAIHNSQSDEEPQLEDEESDFQKYFICEFCGEIHKSITAHYLTHKCFTKCAFCDIELANKRNIQRHYKYKHRFKKNLICKPCNMTVGSESDYIDHCLQEHRRADSSDEDDFENDLCSQIESTFHKAQNQVGLGHSVLENSVTQEFTNINSANSKRKLTDRDSSTFKRLKVEAEKSDTLETSHMFSDSSNSMPSLPDLDFGNGVDDYRVLDKDDTSKPAVTQRLQETLQSKTVPDSEDSDLGHNHPQKNSEAVTKKIISAPRVGRSVKPYLGNTNRKGTLCVHCSQVYLDIGQHLQKHSPEELKACGFCPKKFGRRVNAIEHYQLIHKNRQHISCKLCNNFCIGTEHLYIKHFLTDHKDVVLRNHSEEEVAAMTDSQHATDDSQIENIDLKRKTITPGVNFSALDVCKHCGHIYPKYFMKTHLFQHNQEVLKQCGFCDKTFKDTKVARGHYRAFHKNSNKLPCAYCSSFVGTLQDYLGHYWDEHSASEMEKITQSAVRPKEKKYSVCEFCGDVVQGIHGHYQRHALVDMQICGFCGVKLATKNSVIRHYGSVHRNHDDLICKHCSLKIGSEKKYVRHFLKRHLNAKTENGQHIKAQSCDEQNGSDPKSTTETQLHNSASDSDSGEEVAMNEFKCEMCDEAFGQKYLLKIHRRVHKPTAEHLQCDVCSLRFFGEGGLDRHRKNVHHLNIEKQCEQCGMVFPNNKKLSSHRKIHSDYFPFECQECHKKFKERTNLSNHVKRYHTPDAKYRFTCNTCSKGFDSEATYKSHLRMHTDERPFVCEVCGSGFRNKISLKVHQNIHTDNRPYKCKFCGKGFRQASTMQNHRRIHTGETPFMCHICGKSFHDRGHFHAHRKSSHKDKLGSVTQRRRSSSSTKVPTQVHQQDPSRSSSPFHDSPSMVPNSYSEMNRAVQSITEVPHHDQIPSLRVHSQHQQSILDYQNYLQQMFYPQPSWMCQSK